MLNRPHFLHAARRQRGLSLVELMVGIAVGMFVVAAASTVVATQLVDNRRLMLEVQIQQDLRAAADIITRDLRRADAWGDASRAAVGVWSKEDGAEPHVTPSDIVISGAAGASRVDFYSSRANPTTLGYRRNGTAIESLVGAVWQKLTDENTMEVSDFTVQAMNQPPVQAVCNKLCADGTQACWPTLTVRALRVQITGRSKSDGNVQRSVESVVRPRNDLVSFNDPVAVNLACPE